MASLTRKAVSQGASFLLPEAFQQDCLGFLLGNGRTQESKSGSSKVSGSLVSRSHIWSLLMYLLGKASHRTVLDSRSRKIACLLMKELQNYLVHGFQLTPAL